MIKWGLIGLGKMSNKFAEAIQEIEGSEIFAVASKSKKKSNELLNKFKIKSDFYFNNYEDLLKCKEIDAVYISTLNNTHSELVIKSAKAKKHILCEKPMTRNINETNNAFEILNKEKILFVEAFAYRSHPQTKVLCDIINSGEVGEIKEVETSFGYKSKRIDSKSRIFNKDFGGGAILDVGCYPTSFSLLVARIVNPKKDLSKFKLENVSGILCDTGVDQSAKADLVFNNNLKIKISASVTENLNNISIIYGTRGKIIVPVPWLPGNKSILEVYIKDSYYKKFINSNLSVYANQISLFNEKILKIDEQFESTIMSKNESLINMNIIDQWIKQIY